MKKLTAFFKRLNVRRILSVFLVGILTIASAACSGATTQGANPDNPAVQAGGANNPYKGGGDGYTNLKMSTDPKVSNTKANSGRNQASLEINTQLIAANSEILYPGAETPAGRAEKEAQLPLKTGEDFAQPKPGGLIQRDPDLGERVGERLEKVQEAFQEATGFAKEKADEAGRRPEAQSNPALHK